MSYRLTQNIMSSSEYNVGGITNIWLLDMDDFQSYEFGRQGREDLLQTNLFVNNIHALSPFVELMCEDESKYSETKISKLYKQEINSFIRSLSADATQLLLKASMRKYLIVFRTTQGKHFTLGQDAGATLSYTLVGGERKDIHGYSIKLTVNSIYPLFEISPLAVLNPTIHFEFIPQFDQNRCQLTHDKNTGYLLATYATKQAFGKGNPLDVDGNLCSLSGKKQAMILLEGETNPDPDFYEIVRLYAPGTKVIDGHSTLKYSREKCPTQNSIIVSPSTVDFDENTTNILARLSSTHDWVIENTSSIASCTPNKGIGGTYNLSLTASGQAGTDNLQFKNTHTNEIATIEVSNTNPVIVIKPDPFQKGKDGSVFMWIDASKDPDGVCLKSYDLDSDIELPAYTHVVKTYKTKVVGEYEWTAENLLLPYRNRWGTHMEWANFTDENIDRLMKTNPSNPPINISVSEFIKIHGQWVTDWEQAITYRTDYKFYDERDGNELPEWILPESRDFLQLIGQSPTKHEYPTIDDFVDFVLTSQKDLPAGYGGDWLHANNTSGLSIPPLGFQGASENGDIHNFKKGFGLKMGKSRASQFVVLKMEGMDMNTNSFHMSSARYCRPLSDSELGYKLFVDKTNDKVLMLSNAETSHLPELERGLERGITLRYMNRSHKLILRKWSEIEDEAVQVKNNITFT